MSAMTNPTGKDMSGAVSESMTKVTSLGAGQYREAAVSMRRQLRRLRDDLADLQFAITRNARRAACVTGDYVRANPWKSAGTAAAFTAVAVAALILLSRRD